MVSYCSQQKPLSLVLFKSSFDDINKNKCLFVSVKIKRKEEA